MNRTLLALTVAVFVTSGCDKDVPLLTEPASLVKLGSAANLTGENTYHSTDIPKAILDNQTTSSTLDVANSGFITKIVVRFSITHTFDGDLRISLTNPEGKAIVLVNRRGSGGDNFANTTLDDAAVIAIASGVAPFPLTYAPDEPLSLFNGGSAQGTWKLTVQDVAQQDQGSLTAWSMTITTSDEPPSPPTGTLHTFVSADIPKAILDHQTTTSTVQVPDIGDILKVTVQFSIVHTFTNDLRISLASPEGATVRLLVNRRGGSGDNFTNTTLDDDAPISIASGAAPFNATYRPEQPLSAFIGASAQGTWTLTVEDLAGADQGQLTAWSLSIRTAAASNAAPTASAGGDQTVTRTSAAGANVTLDGSGSSDSDGTIATYEWFDNGESMGSGSTMQHVLPLGTHVVTLVVTDNNGAQSEDDVVITVENSTPTVAIDAAQTLECVAGGATANFSATAADVDGSITYMWSTGSTTPSTSFFALVGSTDVTVTVTDNDGAAAQAVSSVTVVDTQEPTISMLVSPTTLWPANHQMVRVASGISASDACDSSPQLTVVVTSNQAANGSGDGNTASDWNVVANPNGTFDVYVRSERAATAGDRIYTITATAIDGSGNTATSSRTVTVPHSQARK